MAKKISLLVDTDIFIDYFNHKLFRTLFETGEFVIYYSVVTKKELLSKEGLSRSESEIIKKFLKRHRMIGLSRSILQTYSELRSQHPTTHKEDCLIAATAIQKKISLVTRNYRHFRVFKQLKLYFNT